MTATAVRPLPPSMWAPFAVRDFRLLFAGFALGQAMMPLQFVTQIFWVQSHADPSVTIILVGVIGTMRGTGMITFGLFGGALADRFDRRKLLMTTQGTALVLNLAIAVVMWQTSGGTLALTAFFVLTFFASAMFAIDAPTRQAIVPEVLGPRLTPGGIAMNTAAMQLAMPISIFAVGFLIDNLGFSATYALSGTGHVIEIVTLALMTYRSGFARQAVHGARETLRDVREGLAFTRAHPTVMWVILVLVVMMGLGMPATANLGPTWVTTVVGASFSEFGFIALGWGGGAFLASSLWTRFSQIDHRGRLVTIGTLLFASGFVVFSIGHTWPFAVAGNLALGMGMATAQVSATALIAVMAPNRVRGRIMSLLMLNMGVAQTMTLPIAIVGQAVSLETLFPVLAFTCLGFVVVILATHPRIWRARMSDAAPEEVEAAPARPTTARPSAPAPATAAASVTPVPVSTTLLGIARDAPIKRARPLPASGD